MHSLVRGTMKNARFVLYFISIAVIVVLSGCGAMQTYEGETQPPEKVALIKGSIIPFGTSASINSIDGKDVPRTHDDVEVLPGYHELLVTLSSGVYMFYSFAKMKVSFTAKAGHVYRVEGKIHKKETLIWVVDEGDNSIVGGAKP